MNLDYFQTKNLYTATHQLFSETLQIPIQKTGVEVPYSTKEIFENYYKPQNSAFQKIEALFLIGMVSAEVFENENNKNKIVDFEEVKKDTKQDKYKDGILIFAIDFKNKQTPTRSELANLTRNLNQLYNQFPTILVAKYEVENKIQDKNNTNEFHQKIAISSTERLSYKQEWRTGEKIGKIAMLKDIDIFDTHRGHLDILLQMQINRKEKTTNKLENQVNTFEELTIHWLKAFDTKLLSKKFYTEIANWYFWAVENVKFAAYDDKNAQQINEIACIRFITRLVFVWFLREKGLISESFFDEKYIKSLLLNFEPQSENTNDTGIFAQNKKEQNIHSYYNAILQNLFFATLNKPRGSRQFATDEGFHKNRTDNDMNMFYRYEKLFKNQDTEFIINLFDTIPFVNGGLFDSLDSKKEDRFIDGFTRNQKKQAQIPDYLFFSTKSDCFQNQLNKIYETKSKKYEVQGIINILKNYKFTVEENTPLEQDVALDPDLLGQIFENLLAYYNPETGQTARKSSGSFYTPPEIVNYMVEESLLEFFINNFEKQSEEGFTKQNFRELLKIENEESPFSETQNKEILTCIYKNLKILDPACGSGAFPMAILDKLVQLVRKLDNQNIFFENLVKEPIQKQIDEKTKEQKQLIEETTQLVNQIKIEQIKQNALKELEELKQKLTTIENDFNQNLKTNDYARKLHLIQNCIYGIDIQPIAVQITKLRFFLSLIIEQKPDFTQNQKTDNFGIETLPNLEIKFVAANTLIDIKEDFSFIQNYKMKYQPLPPEKDQKTKYYIKEFEDQTVEIKDLKAKLKSLRSDYFALQNPSDKEKVKYKDKEIRHNLKAAFKKAEFNAQNVEKLSSFNIFDQTKEAKFYNSEWMFGIENGFDILIGNPPYIKEYTNKNVFDDLRKSPFYQGKMDLWYFFATYGLSFLKHKGIVTFIAPNNWVTNSGASKMRNTIIKETTIKTLVDFGGYMIFETADIQTMIMIFENDKTKDNYTFDFRKIIAKNPSFNHVTDILKNKENKEIEYLKPTLIKNNFIDKTLTFSSNKAEEILTKMKNQHDFILNKKTEVAQGIVPNPDVVSKNALYKIPQSKIDEFSIKKGQDVFVVKKEFIDNLTKEENFFLKPLYEPNQLSKFFIPNNISKYMIYITNKNFSKKIETLPNIKNHLEKFKEIMEDRRENLLGRINYYNLHWGRDENFFKEGEKILCVRKCSEPTFVYTTEPAYVMMSMNIIKTTRLNQKYLTGLLNSKLIAFWLKNKGKMQGNNYQIDKEPLLEIPIKKISPTEQQPFISLVERILVLKKEGKSSSFEEKELDNLVFDLYGLSEEEKALVGGDD